MTYCENAFFTHAPSFSCRFFRLVSKCVYYLLQQWLTVNVELGLTDWLIGGFVLLHVPFSSVKFISGKVKKTEAMTVDLTILRALQCDNMVDALCCHQLSPVQFKMRPIYLSSFLVSLAASVRSDRSSAGAACRHSPCRHTGCERRARRSASGRWCCPAWRARRDPSARPAPWDGPAPVPGTGRPSWWPSPPAREPQGRVVTVSTRLPLSLSCSMLSENKLHNSDLHLSYFPVYSVFFRVGRQRHWVRQTHDKVS